MLHATLYQGPYTGVGSLIISRNCTLLDIIAWAVYKAQSKGVVASLIISRHKKLRLENYVQTLLRPEQSSVAVSPPSGRT